MFQRNEDTCVCTYFDLNLAFMVSNKALASSEYIAGYLKQFSNAIRNYESGLRIPSIKNIEKLAKIYQCNPAYILGWIK